MSLSPERMEGILIGEAVADTMGPEREQSLAERFTARIEAFEELEQAVTKSIPGASSQEIDFALGYLYDAGNPDTNRADIKVHLEAHIGWMRSRAKDEEEQPWLPKDDEELARTIELVFAGSMIGDKDYVPVYGPATDKKGGRPFEILDETNTLYNKYGFSIPYYRVQTSEA